MTNEEKRIRAVRKYREEMYERPSGAPHGEAREPSNYESGQFVWAELNTEERAEAFAEGVLAAGGEVDPSGPFLNSTGKWQVTYWKRGALPPEQGRTEADEHAWLIETYDWREGHQAQYLGANGYGWLWYDSPLHRGVLRFTRREDAENVRQSHFRHISGVRAAEHIWTDSRTPPREGGTPE
jgi:hypothetical protein